MEYFVQSGILSADQVDGSYDGTPAAFVAAGGADAQQGFGSAEPYIYENEIAEWGKPIAYEYINDAGWENYGESIATRPENIETYADCFALLVPILQQSTIDYLSDPAETNDLIIRAVQEFNNGWVYTPGVAEYAVNTMHQRRAHGQRSERDARRLRPRSGQRPHRDRPPGLRVARPRAAGRPDRRGRRHQPVHRPVDRPRCPCRFGGSGRDVG